MNWPPDMTELLESCGYVCASESEPDYEQRRIDALLGIARSASWWRKQYAEAQNGVMREREYIAIWERCEAAEEAAGIAE